RNAHAIILPRHRREVAHDDNKVFWIQRLADECQHAIRRVVRLEPFEAVPLEIHFMHGALARMQTIQITDQILHAFVPRRILKLPLDLSAIPELMSLRQFAAHESSFLPGCAYIYPKSSRRFANFCQSSPGIFSSNARLPCTTSSCESGKTKFSWNA